MERAFALLPLLLVALVACGDDSSPMDGGLVDSAIDSSADAGPMCPSEQSLCGDACIDTTNNRAHCGACDNACVDGQVCNDGTCTASCGGDTPTLCGDACIDTMNNRAHCGACDNACADGQVCSDGACTASCGGDTPTLCGDACIDTTNNRAHCGACDNACADGQVCSDGACTASCGMGLLQCGGVCTDTDHDPNHCGGCDQSCDVDGATATWCEAGACQTLCPDSQEVCDGGCVDTQNDAMNCGACGNTCMGDIPCRDGACVAFDPATLTPCGATGADGPTEAACTTAYAGSSVEGQITVAAGIQQWTVPHTGTYRFEVAGARGGNHQSQPGGFGAVVAGDFALTSGQVIQILVGQRGQDGMIYDMSAGGGTFVVTADNMPLIIAGGGGTAGNCSPSAAEGGLSTMGDGSGGAAGNNGGWCGCGGDGSGGGGFSGDGGADGGRAFLNGGQGDTGTRPSQCVTVGAGGFGGGGNGGNGGGGGGGYQGGHGGGAATATSSGGGGLSYNVGTNPMGMSAANDGDGYVSITFVDPPM